MWKYIYLAKEFVPLSSIFGNAVCKVSYQNYTCFVFQHDPSMDPLDFRLVLSSVRFSRKWLGWHKWITHTKLYWFWPTIIQVLMPTLKSLVSHDEFWFVQPVFPEEEIRSLRRSSWPPTAVTNTKDFFSSCLVLIRVKIGMVLWSCRKNSRVQSCD